MMRKLAVVADYLNDSHRAHIEKMAGDAGFTVDYFTEGHLPQDRAGEYEVIYGTVPPKELKAATALRWFCCSYAGMDQWKDDALYYSPEVMLSNSSGAYGVTISEHMVMVTLMLLRQMPAYLDADRAGVDAPPRLEQREAPHALRLRQPHHGAGYR